jgi:hypothetical protein
MRRVWRYRTARYSLRLPILVSPTGSGSCAESARDHKAFELLVQAPTGVQWSAVQV